MLLLRPTLRLQPSRGASWLARHAHQQLEASKVKKSTELPLVPPSNPVATSSYIRDAFPEEVSASDLVLQKPESTKPNSWYTVSRTRSGQLPIYSDLRVDGSVKTIVRRIDGNVSLLRQDLQKSLGLAKNRIFIKDTSKQIVIRGDYVSEVRKILGKTF